MLAGVYKVPINLISFPIPHFQLDFLPRTFLQRGVWKLFENQIENFQGNFQHFSYRLGGCKHLAHPQEKLRQRRKGKGEGKVREGRLDTLPYISEENSFSSLQFCLPTFPIPYHFILPIYLPLPFLFSSLSLPVSLPLSFFPRWGWGKGILYTPACLISFSWL